MSGDQDASPKDSDIEKVMREAEAAVDKVRGQGDESDGDDEVDDIDIDDEPDFEQQLAEARAEGEALRDKWLRSVAELENYKKRVKRDIDDAVHRAVQSMLGNFLPVGDNLERALSVIPAGVDENLVKGLEMVRQEFFNALSKNGITPVEAVGKAFDPAIHDALQQMDSQEYAPGVVTMEYEKGYMRSGKLIRPARVIVAGPGSTGTKGTVERESATEEGADN